MTEQQLRQLPQFRDLPIADDSDAVAYERLTRIYEPARYDGTWREAEDRDQLDQLLEDHTYDPKGMIRYQANDVRPIFWKKRSQ